MLSMITWLRWCLLGSSTGNLPFFSDTVILAFNILRSLHSGMHLCVYFKEKKRKSPPSLCLYSNKPNLFFYNIHFATQLVWKKIKYLVLWPHNKNHNSGARQCGQCLEARNLWIWSVADVDVNHWARHISEI